MPPFPGQPVSVRLPTTSTLVEDPDEEIFLLYVRKQTTPAPAPTPASTTAPASAPPAAAAGAGLGFLSSKQDILPIELRITRPPGLGRPPIQEHVIPVKKKVKGKRKAEEEEVVVSVEVQQSLATLRNRKGDTGSVLWRVSLHFAQYFLTAHHFPSPRLPPLLPHLPTSRVLELGSGTGFLGLALRQIVGHWTFTDQLASLDLVAKNLDRNGVTGGDLQELDWIVEGAPGGPRGGRGDGAEAAAPDVIVAADCIYNPSLARPLARTIDACAGAGTVALVASELRDAEPLEEFLREWVEGCGWTVARVGEAAEGEGEEAEGEEWSGRMAHAIFGKEFVVWIGWKAQEGAKGKD